MRGLTGLLRSFARLDKEGKKLHSQGPRREARPRRPDYMDVRLEFKRNAVSRFTNRPFSSRADAQWAGSNPLKA